MKAAPGFQKHPDHPLDIKHADGNWELSLAGEKIATSSNVLILSEGGYPDRFYFPVQDIKSDCIRPIDHHSYCPFKGTARYWDVVVGKDVVAAAAWGYDDPYFECAGLAGHVCFYLEKAAFEIKKS